jgi:hypothetical protein
MPSSFATVSRLLAGNPRRTAGTISIDERWIACRPIKAFACLFVLIKASCHLAV